MSALTVTLGADTSSMKRSLGGAMGMLSGFAKRISGVFSLKGGIIGALAGGSTAALATKLASAQSSLPSVGWAVVASAGKPPWTPNARTTASPAKPTACWAT